MKTITIVIPAYNAEGTIERTLGSIVAQTDRDVSAIVVDDCSVNPIETVVEPFRRWFPVRVIRQEVNKGCGETRNAGLSAVESDYVIFMDADDMFCAPHAIALMRDAMETGADIVSCQFYEQMEDMTTLVEHNSKEKAWLHGKAYSVPFLRRNGIAFPPNRVNEDVGFSLSVFGLAKGCAFIETPVYFWAYTPTSITRSADCNATHMSDYIRSFSWMYDTLEKAGRIDDLSSLSCGEAFAYAYYFTGDMKNRGVEQKWFDVAKKSLKELEKHTGAIEFLRNNDYATDRMIARWPAIQKDAMRSCHPYEPDVTFAEYLKSLGIKCPRRLTNPHATAKAE